LSVPEALREVKQSWHIAMYLKPRVLFRHEGVARPEMSVETVALVEWP